MPKFAVEASDWGRYSRCATITVEAESAAHAEEQFWEVVTDADWSIDLDSSDGETNATVSEVTE